jgi:ABC-type multidrug transport system permease subunit
VTFVTERSETGRRGEIFGLLGPNGAPLPAAFRSAAYANPITWHVDVVRYATVGIGPPRMIAIEAASFVLFTIAAFAIAVRALQNQE